MAKKQKPLTFQTPQKKASTPLRKSSSSKSSDIIQSPENVLTSLENQLIESYRTENQFLRNLKNDVLLYVNMLGVSISEEEGKLAFTIQRTSKTGKKLIKFDLEENNDNLTFNLKDFINCNIPNYFNDPIMISRDTFPYVFYKAMQCVYENRTNE